MPIRLFFLVCFSLSSMAKSPPLIEVVVDGNDVSVRSENIDITPSQIKMIEDGFEEIHSHAPSSEKAFLSFKGKEALAIERQLKNIAWPNATQRKQALHGIWHQITDRSPASYPSAAISDGKSKVYLGESFEVGPGERIDSLVAIGSTGRVAGRVHELVAIGSQIEFLSSAVVDEDFVSIGSTIAKQPGAMLEPNEVNMLSPFSNFSSLKDFEIPYFFWWPAKLIWTLFTFLVGLVLGFLLLKIAPSFSEETVFYLKENYLSAFGLGFLAQVLFLPGALLLAVTVVGIPLIPVYAFLILVAFILGYLCLSYCVGAYLPLKSKLEGTSAMAGGLAVLSLLRLIPWLGSFLVYLALVAGLGASLRQIYARLSHRF